MGAGAVALSSGVLLSQPAGGDANISEVSAGSSGLVCWVGVDADAEVQDIGGSFGGGGACSSGSVMDGEYDGGSGGCDVVGSSVCASGGPSSFLRGTR